MVQYEYAFSAQTHGTTDEKKKKKKTFLVNSWTLPKILDMGVYRIRPSDWYLPCFRNSILIRRYQIIIIYV